MEHILNKISSYNIFNFLFPGAIFCVLAERFDIISPAPQGIVERLLWYYVIGLAISRIGSVLLEPALKRIRIISYSDYSKYLSACQNDEKMDIMVEVSNTYRTLFSASFVLVSSYIMSRFADLISLSYEAREGAVVLLLLVLFLFSFKKQSGYISKRVDHFGITL